MVKWTILVRLQGAEFASCVESACAALYAFQAQWRLRCCWYYASKAHLQSICNPLDRRSPPAPLAPLAPLALGPVQRQFEQMVAFYVSDVTEDLVTCLRIALMHTVHSETETLHMDIKITEHLVKIGNVHPRAAFGVIDSVQFRHTLKSCANTTSSEPFYIYQREQPVTQPKSVAFRSRSPSSPHPSPPPPASSSRKVAFKMLTAGECAQNLDVNDCLHLASGVAMLEQDEQTPAACYRHHQTWTFNAELSHKSDLLRVYPCSDVRVCYCGVAETELNGTPNVVLMSRNLTLIT